MHSTQYALTEAVGINASFAHGLSAKPTFIRAVLLCTANDAASQSVIGDELDVNCFYNTSDVSMMFLVKCDATNIHVWTSYLVAMEFAVPLPPTAIGSFTSMTNFSLKVYWQ
jgi:hypothetical protein